jgi:hypothetical protein
MPKQTIRVAAWVRPTLGALGIACGLFLATAGNPALAEDSDAQTSIGRLFCPECGMEMPWGDEPPEKNPFCPRCQSKKVLMKFLPKGSARPHRPEESLFSGQLGKFMIGLVVFLTIGWLLLWRARVRQQAALEETRWLFRCPSCSRDIQYRQSLAGSQDICSFCKNRFVYPDPTTGPDDAVRNQKTVKKWTHEMAKLPRRKKAP